MPFEAALLQGNKHELTAEPLGRTMFIIMNTKALYVQKTEQTLKVRITQLDEKLTLLPKSVRHSVKDFDDAF